MTYKESNFKRSACEYAAPTTFLDSGDFEELEELECQNSELGLEDISTNLIAILK